MSPPKGVRARNSFNLGTSLATTLGLESDHRSYRGTSHKSTRAPREIVLERGERACEICSAVGEPRYT